MRQVIKLTLLCMVISPLLFAADYRFVNIDFPNAIETLANGINARGDIVGRYLDIDGVYHGYLLSKDVFSTIDFPGATYTAAFSLNARGDIVGHIVDANGTDHGFLLRDGKFTQIDYPGGAPGTEARGIDNAGDIVGDHFNGTGIEHGFIFKDGVFHKIHVPGSCGEHVSMAQDNGRVLVGSFCTNLDAPIYGFVRNRLGEFQSINFGHGLVCTGARWINEKGDIVGVYGPNCAGVRHGYLLRQGKFVTIDPPGAVDTQSDAINDDGVIVGEYTDRAGVTHGYKAILEDEVRQ